MNVSICHILFPALKFLPDDLYLKLMYRRQIGKPLNLKNPKTFNQKLQWLKLHDRNTKYIKFVDKYEVRQYIRDRIGERYLIPLVGGPWNSVDDINFDNLDDQFVLKCTHDSGSAIICDDKTKFDVEAAIITTRNNLNRNYFWIVREWPYKFIKPRIIIEKYLEEQGVSGLIDYKFMCFNGTVRCIFTCTDRKNKKLKVTFFDRKWNRLPFVRHYPADAKTIQKPRNFDKMIKISETLSKGLPFARIDLYEFHSKIYFSEITLYPGSGFEEFSPEVWDKTLGDWIDLSVCI